MRFALTTVIRSGISPRTKASPAGLAVAGGIVYTAGVNVGAGVYALRDGRRLWRVPLSVYTGPTVAGGLVYLVSEGNVSNGETSSLYVLRAGDGSKAWSFPNGEFYLPPVFSGIAYVWDGTSVIYAVRASTGEHIWHVGGVSSVETVANNGTVYVTRNNDLCALRGHDGRELWRFPTDGMQLTLTASGSAVYVALNNLHALRAADGKELWSFPVAGTPAGPVVAGNVVYFGGADNRVYALRA